MSESVAAYPPVEPAVREIRIGLLGCGNVGQALVRAVTTEAPRLREVGMRATCTIALVRDTSGLRSGCDLQVTADPESWRQHACDVVVEVLGGIEPARTLVADVLRSGTPVVTANKSLIAAHGSELAELAAAHHTAIYHEAAVLAGVPCVNTLSRRPLASGGGHWAGILNGTSNFILTEMARGRTFDDAQVAAVARGYAEPSLTAAEHADLSGRDAAEKLTILLHLAGHRDVAVKDIPRHGISDVTSWQIALARRLAGVIKPVAIADTAETGGAWVGPALVPMAHPFASVEGVTNVLAVGRGQNTVWFKGPGAGPDVTAVTLLDDVIEAATGGRHAQPAGATAGPVAGWLRSPIPGAWFLTLEHVSASDASLAEFLAAHHLPAVAMVRDDHHVAAVTVRAPFIVVNEVVHALQSSGVDVSAWPVLDSPKDLSHE